MQLSYRTETSPLVSVYSYDNRHRHFVSSSMTTEWLMTLKRISGRERGKMVENEIFNNYSPLNCLEVKLLNYFFTIVVISKKKKKKLWLLVVFVWYFNKIILFTIEIKLHRRRENEMSTIYCIEGGFFCYYFDICT